MKNKYNKKINKYISNQEQVKIYYFEDEIYGQILINSNDFILIKDIKDWHFDGYIIFPKNYISKIRCSKLEKFRKKLIVNKIVIRKEMEILKWLNLTSFENIFISLRDHYNKVCIEGADKNINQFIIGEINKVNNKEISIYKLNIYGKLSSKEIKVPNKDITCIYFADEYSSILFNYNEKSRESRGDW